MESMNSQLFTCLPVGVSPSCGSTFSCRPGHTKSNTNASGPHGKVVSWFGAFLPRIWVHINSSRVTQEKNMQSRMARVTAEICELIFPMFVTLALKQRSLGSEPKSAYWSADKTSLCAHTGPISNQTECLWLSNFQAYLWRLTQMSRTGWSFAAKGCR